MASLTMELPNTQVTYQYDASDGEWCISSNSRLNQTFSRFEIFRGSNILNGFSLDCCISIKINSLKNVARINEIAQSVHSTTYKPEIQKFVGTAVLEFSSSENNENPYIDVVILLPEKEFFRIQGLSESCSVSLRITTWSFECGLIYGDDPDGRDIKWLSDITPASIIASAQFLFSPRL